MIQTIFAIVGGMLLLGMIVYGFRQGMQSQRTIVRIKAGKPIMAAAEDTT